MGKFGGVLAAPVIGKNSSDSMLNLFLLLKLSYSFTLRQECGLHLC